MRSGFSFFISLALHLCLIAVAFFAMPDGWVPSDEVELPIPVELISKAELAKLTNIPATKKQPTPEPEQPAPDVAESLLVEPLPADPLPEPEVEIDAPPPLPEPEEVKTPKPVDEQPPKEEPKEDPNFVAPKEETPTAPEEEIDQFEIWDEAANNNAPDKPPSAPKETPDDLPGDPTEAEQDRAGAGNDSVLTASIKAKMKAKLSSCWNPPIGAPEPEKLVVKIEFQMDQQGVVTGQPKVLNGGQIDRSGNPFWKAARQEALRTVMSCGPYDFLPTDQYAQWKDFEVNFAADIGL